MSYTQIKLEMHRKQNNVGSCLTVTTRSNLTSERTPKGDPRFAWGLLGVCFSKICVRFGSALGLLGVRSVSALRGSLNALRREADPALLLLSGSPTPCIYIPNKFSNTSQKSFIFGSNWKHTCVYSFCACTL